MIEFPLVRPVSTPEKQLSEERLISLRFHFIAGNLEDFRRTSFHAIGFLPDPSKNWYRFHEFPDKEARLMLGEPTVKSVEKIGRSGYILAKGLILQPRTRIYRERGAEEGLNPYSYDPSVDPVAECIFPLAVSEFASANIRQWYGLSIIGLLKPDINGEVKVVILPGEKPDTRKVVVRLTPKLSLTSPEVALPFALSVEDKGEIIPVEP